MEDFEKNFKKYLKEGKIYEGDNDEFLINKISSIAQSRGYEEVKDHYRYVDEEEGIEPVKTFVEDLNDEYTNIVHIYKEGEALLVFYGVDNGGGSSGNDSAETWAREDTWEEFDGDY